MFYKLRTHYFFYILSFLFCLQNVTFAQNISNEGTEFWASFPSHDASNGSLANMNIFITSRSNSEVTVSCGAYTETKQIPANTAVPFTVPRNVSYIERAEANTNLQNRGIKVKVTQGRAPVAAYAHVYAGARSAATLLLPYEALGQKYYSMNYEQDGNGRNFLTLVAADDNTTLLLKEYSGNLRTITLAKAGDTYEYLAGPNEDLTGVFVEVDPSTSQCKRFAAFSGSTSTIILCGTSRDPLLQQLYTTTSWGKNYAVAPFANRRSVLRILAQEDNTLVNVGGATVTLNKGRFIETEARSDAMMIKADKLISVAQYSLTQNCSSVNGTNLIGDPDMILLNPIEFSIKKITLFSSDKIAIVERFINVVIKTESISSFRINGAVPVERWQTFPANPEFSYIQLAAYSESITISANDGFNAIAYGFGNAESYGYSAGTSLASNQYISVVSKSTKAEQSNACINQLVTLKITMPFKLDRVIWTFGDDNSILDDIAPVATARIANGETLYDYSIPTERTYNVLGPQTIKATGYFSNDGNACFVGSADFEFNFTVDPYPTAKFDAVEASCTSAEVSFTDLSVSNAENRVLRNWLWDFGDGTTSTLQHPKHVYSSPGLYTVKLIVASESGCYSEVFSKDVEVYKLPEVLFSSSSVACEKKEIAFSSQSTTEKGNIISYLWDFGDGNTSTEVNPSHIYDRAGDYLVSLKVGTSLGCNGNLSKSIKVNAMPVLDFDLPEICANDGTALFTNTSTIASNEAVTYNWDFGDNFADLINPNTLTSLNGTHRYTRAGIYEVTLTATSQSGCLTSIKKQFRVNGSLPKASFEVTKANELCSAAPVVLKDLASVDFGEISRIEWFLDYDNKITPDFTDENPNLRSGAPKMYAFNYPVFSDVATKVFKVKMRVYSGNSCFAEMEREIVLTAVPQLDFGNPVEICYEANPIKLLASEKNSLPGEGAFTGVGVTKDGIFTPTVAGVGVHTITYAYKIGEGCSKEITQEVRVYSSPIANAGADLDIYEGDEKVISATAGGNNLTYKWSPSEGLDRDDVINPTVKPTKDMTYTLKVTSENGCVNTDEVRVKLLRNLEIPSAITPNGDGINDKWNIKYIEIYKEATIELFDRSGSRVYRSQGYQTPFDGTFNGTQVPTGVYYYMINLNRGRKPITGALTIIK
jgi:gliding motility-associated-like protein